MSNPKTKYAHDCIDRAVKQWFANHKATFTEINADNIGKLYHLRWARTENSTYFVDYLIHGSTLFVKGDLGHAVYRWGQILTWEFLAGCDWSYMLEKCEASENGRQFYTFDSGVAEEFCTNYLKDMGVRLNMGWGGEEEFIEFLKEHRKDFGPDWCQYGDEGRVPNCRFFGHWVGIKMAMGKKIT